MGIPYRFDPLGTLEGWLPYTQPIMVSDNDWSNKTGPGAAPFGMTLSGTGTTYGVTPRWRAFDGNDDTDFGYFSGTKPNPLTGADSYYIDITFSAGMKIRIDSLSILCGSSSASYTANCSASMYNLDAGEPGEGTSPLAEDAGSGTQKRTLTLTPTAPVTANKFRIYFNVAVNPARLGRIYEVSITAKYKK